MLVKLTVVVALVVAPDPAPDPEPVPRGTEVGAAPVLVGRPAAADEGEAVTGQTVVYAGTTVVITVVWVASEAGQSVTVGAQLVMVMRDVVETVLVV